MTRRSFLRGPVQRDRSDVIRPPGSVPGRFEALCTECQRCEIACEEQIITQDATGRAMLDLSKGACTFCGICTEICPTGALSAAHVDDWPWRAQVAASCLSMNGVACRACEDACEARAITFQLHLAGRAAPQIDGEACTGCGGCVGVCPVGAIGLARPAPQHPEVHP